MARRAMSGIGCGSRGRVSMPETSQYLMEHGRADEAQRSLDWIRGAPAKMEFAALQVQLDDHPLHKVIADYSSSLQCNWFLI